MTTTEHTQAAARVITEHRRDVGAGVICRCGKPWSPLHVAEMLDAAGLLVTTEKP